MGTDHHVFVAPPDGVDARRRTPAIPSHSEGASRAMYAHCRQCGSRAQSSIRLWYWFAKASSKLAVRTLHRAEVRSSQPRALWRRRARRRRLLPRSPSGRRGFPRIQLKQIAVGDRGSLKGLTHFPRSASVVRIELAESKRDARKRTSGADVVVAPLWAFSTSARVPTARIFPSLTATAARPGVAADDDPRGGQNRSPSPGPHG